MSIEQTAQKKNTEDILNELESLVIRIVPKEKILKKIVNKVKDKVIYVDDNVITYFTEICTEITSIQKEGEIREHFYFAPEQESLNDLGIMLMFSRKNEAEFWCLEWYDDYSLDEIIQRPVPAIQSRYYKLKD